MGRRGRHTVEDFIRGHLPKGSSDGFSDDELAACLIQDMRLLMAGRVEIANKQILREPHKRAAMPIDELPQATIELTDDLSASELLSRASRRPIRVIAKDGECYKVSRLVA